MASDDLADRFHNVSRRADRAKVFDAVVTSGPGRRSGQVHVQIPSFGRQQWPVDFWSPRDGDYPEKGNPAAVMLTNTNQIVMVAFMPGPGSGGGAKGGVRPGGATSFDPSKVLSGTPKDVIDNVVLPIGASHNLNAASGAPLTPENVAAANSSHPDTSSSGNLSDHAGPGNERWAVDMGMGTSSPTPQMDACAEELAQVFRLSWTGNPPAGSAEDTRSGFNFQLIYRTPEGSVYGNHMDHVHFGLHVT